MPVITISRQTGSGGATLGHQVAARLHADYLNTQIIQLVAERLGISAATAAEHNERAEAFGERLTHVLATLDPSLAALSRPVPPLPVDSTTTAFVAVTRELVRAAAARGNSVIFGHGAQFILAGQPGILHVRVVAPLPQRVERVMQRTGWAQALAERWVRAEDQRRAAHIRQFYQADWHAPDPFHLILNTGRWAEAACIELILAAVAALQRQQER